MSEQSMLILLATTNICSAAIAYLVTMAYWRDKHYDTLRSIAERRPE